MNHPKLAMCNFIPSVEELKDAALENGFAGVDWTFKLEDLPKGALEEARLLRQVSSLHPLEVRYHCAFNGIDLGDLDASRASFAAETFRRACRAVSAVDGKFMTIHMGLGRESMDGLSWERTIGALADLVDYAGGMGINLCLENLASGWSSRPELFEKLIRKSGAGVTLDVGHARVCQSVECQQYAFEDFVLPHAGRIFNAHIYHEERDSTHFPPRKVEDVFDRLSLLSSLPCDWWVLELREKEALQTALKVVREFLDSCPAHVPMDQLAAN